MTASLQQLLAASALIVTCEKIVGSNWLPEAEEQNLRVLITRCCRAYGLATIAERPAPANDSDFDAQLALVSQALAEPRSQASFQQRGGEE
jgi:hypothetical protein